MPTKICQKCQKQVGPRTLRCECGYVFVKTSNVSAVPANAGTMELKNELSDAKKLLENISRRTFAVPEPWSKPDEKSESKATEVVGNTALRLAPANPMASVTYAPSGECPFKPEGFKSIDWASGPASEAVVANWAIRVFNSGITDQHRFHPHAIVYWARYFWQMGLGNSPHAKEWSRIKAIILKTLSNKDLEQNIEEYNDV